MREVPHQAGPDLPNEVHHYEMKDHVGEDEIRECSLMTDSSKLGLVSGIDLNIDDVKRRWGMGGEDHTWRRRQTPRTNEATLEMKPERNALNGKVPTRQQ